MPAEAIVMGPFAGGLNNVSDPASINDDELAECVNLELDLNGSLVARPPFVASAGPGASHVRAIGNCIFGTESYVIFANAAGVWAQKLSDGTFVTITATAPNPLCAIQYAGFLWIIPSPGSSANGGKWDGTTYTAVAAIPKAGSAIVYKERMWLCPGYFATTNTSRLFFSAIADPGSWTTGTDFFDISPGDGQKLIDLVIYNNNLILFKDDSTYALSYTSAPSDATVLKINNTVGVSRHYCMVPYERTIYVLHEGRVFEIVNYNWSDISLKVFFTAASLTPGTFTEDMCMSLIGDRLVVRHFENVWVYGIRTKTWSQWTSADSSLNSLGAFVEHPNVLSSLPLRIYKAGVSLTSPTHIVTIKEFADATTVEKNSSAANVTITCYATTKNYDFGVSYVYKRLSYWGADVLTINNVIGTASPITFGVTVTWADLASSTWGSLGSWASPTTINPDVTTTVVGASGTLRRFLKMAKGLRFRQIKFKVQMTTGGSTADGPCKLYTITAFAGAKQYTSKSVS